MKDSTALKIIEFFSTPAANVVQEVVEKTGKTSVVAGGVIYTAEQILPQGFSLTQYAAIVSIIGGVVWVIKLCFDMYITYLKYKRGDIDNPN